MRFPPDNLTVWPILHTPTFVQRYHSLSDRQNPSFVALVLSTCCLSSRYAQDPRLVDTDTASRLLGFAKQTVANAASVRADLELVQALFNMSVVQEGTARPDLLWVYLSQAIS